MTILVTSDWQLDDNPLNAYRHDFQKQLRAIVKKHKVKVLLMLGDLTEQKDKHSAWLVNKIVSHLDELRRLCEVVIIQGNHDYLDINSPFYEFVDHIQGITWIGRPTDNSGGGLVPIDLSVLGKVLLLPHTPNWKHDWKNIKLKSYQWVFTHATFQNAHVGQGVQIKGLPLDMFGGARVIAGDIHIPQKITANVTYVGAPYLCDFGDRYEPRVLLIDQERVGAIGRVVSIAVKGAQKRLVEVTSLSELREGSINTRYCSPGDILKVRLVIAAAQKATWPELKTKVREWGEKNGYLIHVVQPVLIDTLRGTNKIQVSHEKISDEGLLRQYAKHRGIDKLTLRSGLNLLKRV